MRALLKRIPNTALEVRLEALRPILQLRSHKVEPNFVAAGGGAIPSPRVAPEMLQQAVRQGSPATLTLEDNMIEGGILGMIFGELLRAWDGLAASRAK